MATLRITAGPARGQRIECDRELVIGRADADLVIDDAEISRRHAVVRPVADGIEVEDLGSLNGTFVDGERISAPVTLKPGATLKLGITSLAVEVAPAGAAAPSAEAEGGAPAPPARAETAVRGAAPEPPPVPAGPVASGRPQPGGPPGRPGIPAGGPGGGPPWGPGGPPAPIRLLMKSERGRRLLALLMRLPPPVRPLALLLGPLLIVGLIVLVAVLL